jgi:purine-nucleoside phosphorylase
MITDSYDIETEPMINLFDFYGRRGDFADICLIIFSKEIHRHLLDSYESEIIATMPACNGDTHIYKTTYKGVTITFYLSGIGSAVASSQCHLASWLTGASKFIMFGSCGSLDRTTTQGRFIIPTQSYRGDGCSYYFAAPSDYIDIAASKELSIIFDKLSVPYITGKIWTTDSMIRETKGLVRKLVGYTIGKNASVFKASAIGRKFMVSQLEATWKKMHPKPTQVKMRPASPSISPARPARPVAQTTKPTQSNSKPLPVATKTAFNINVGGEMKRIYIPNTVKDIFLNEVQVPDSDMTASREDISHVGMLLFLDMIDAATTVSESCGGGGSAPSSGWGKDDDEDERERARRCLQMAHAMCKPPQKRRSFHR